MRPSGLLAGLFFIALLAGAWLDLPRRPWGDRPAVAIIGVHRNAAPGTNWCQPACGEWNAWCAGQSLPSVIARMSPRSYFADPKWLGQNYADP
jgi:hypothetical protein